MGAAVRAHALAVVATLVGSPATVAGVMALNRLTAPPKTEPRREAVVLDVRPPTRTPPPARRKARLTPAPAAARRTGAAPPAPLIAMPGGGEVPGVAIPEDVFRLPPTQAEDLVRELVSKDELAGPATVDDVDTPPRLVAGTLQVDVPREFARRQIPGRVVVLVVIDAGGRVTSVTPREASHDILRDPVVRAVRAARFEPATVDGRPVESMFELTVPFEVG